MYMNKRLNIPILLVHALQVLSVMGFGFLYSSLTIFLISNLGFSNTEAYYLTSKYLYFNFTVAIVIGVLSKNIFNFYNIFIFSILIQIFGFIVLIYTSSNVQLALFLIAVGTGCIIPSITFFTYKHSSGRSLLKNNFLNYGFMNIGFIIIFFLAGSFKYDLDMHLIIYFLICCLILAVILKVKYTSNESSNIGNKAVIKLSYYFAVLLIIVAYYVFVTASLFILTVISLGIIFFILRKIYLNNRKLLFFNYIMMLILGTIFFSIYYLIPLIISVHIKYENITIYGYIIKPQFFLFFGTNIVVLSSIIISLIYRKKDILEFNYINIFLIAFGLVSIAFFCLSFPIFIDKEYSSYCLILFFIFISTAEIFILPVGYSYITKILNFDGTAIAVWLYCCGSIAIYCS